MIPFVTVIAVLLAVTALAPIVMKALGARGFALLALAPAAGFVLFLQAPEADWAIPWVPSLGIELAFRLDGLSRLFALLITGLGTLILLYSAGYFSPKYEVVRFSAAFMGFMTAMLGLVLSDDILGLFVFWELTSITSYLLIGYHHEKEESRKGAQQAFLITGAGGLAMLVGMVLLARKRVVAICVLGVVGTGIGILFLAFGAPDLAMTQLLTELLTIILAVLVIHRLPKFRSLSTIPTRIRDGAIAISFGLSMMLLVLVVQNADRSEHVVRYYANNAVEKAYGSNVVNTILVDFRAMDTLGEIVVLAVAALGVYALMHLRIRREEE